MLLWAYSKTWWDLTNSLAILHFSEFDYLCWPFLGPLVCWLQYFHKICRWNNCHVVGLWWTLSMSFVQLDVQVNVWPINLKISPPVTFVLHNLKFCFCLSVSTKMCFIVIVVMSQMHICHWFYLVNEKFLNFHIVASYHGDSFCLQCFDTVGWASGRASGL